MGSIADILSTKIEEGKVTTSQIEKEQANKKTVDHYCPAGIDSPPLKDDKVLIVKIDGSQFVSIGNLLIGTGAEEGETVVYSRDASGEIAGKMYIKKDGTITFNGGEDFAVAFNGLKTELENFQAIFNGHTHPAPGGATSPTASTSSMVLDNAKIQDIKFPSGGVS